MGEGLETFWPLRLRSDNRCRHVGRGVDVDGQILCCCEYLEGSATFFRGSARAPPQSRSWPQSLTSPPTFAIVRLKREGGTAEAETESRRTRVPTQRPGRNERCHRGSRRKYKRCCMVRDEAVIHEKRGVELPGWIIGSRRKLHLRPQQDTTPADPFRAGGRSCVRHDALERRSP